MAGTSPAMTDLCDIALARLLRRQNRAFAPGANEPAGHGAGMFAAREDRRAGDHCRLITLDALHETPPAGWHIVHEFGLAHFEIIEVDHVDIGAQSRCEPPAIGKTEEIGGLAGLALDQAFDRQARSAAAVAAPMHQHEGRYT